ncbi:MAG: non-heme chloroperoxidase [Glaciecola sp.]|jgi:non-heme chloroperoxidase|uniref:alpha/beta fold hydrolase n=1 Tax=Congregibacter sp. TaxID=2744308 RepID=UPI0039E54803
MAYLTVDGNYRVYYEDHGHGDMALLLIHGWGMSSRVWDGVLIPLLDAGYRVVTMDHRGCGRSDHDFEDLGIEAIASDVVKLATSLGLKKVVLNGWSLGGAVATQAAHDLGSSCAGLILTAGASPIYTQKPDLNLGGTADDVVATVAAIDADRINFLSGLSHAVCAKPVTEKLTDWMADCFIESAARASSTLGELAHLDQRDILLALDLPVLSFICEQDGFVAPGISRWVADNHPRARGVIFPESGHAPFIEEREAYLQELHTFISSL